MTHQRRGGRLLQDHHEQEREMTQEELRLSWCNKSFSSLLHSSSDSLGFSDDIDLEMGSAMTSVSAVVTVRDQSKRLSELITAKTELANLNPVHPDAPAPMEEEETSGLRYWMQEARGAKEHGGDYVSRSQAAFRAALGSLTIFSVLVFPHQNILGAVWIGNIFMHSNIKDSIGASLASVKGFGTSIIITTVFSWPVATFLTMLTVTQASILLPFVIFILSFIIMSCPQLTSRNLMILVMYIVVASNVREKIEPWEPFGWVATYLIGLAVAVLVNIFPRRNSALGATHTQLDRLEKDITMLLLQCKAYADNTATSPGVSRAAIASIELLQNRITKTVKTLKAKLPGTKVELSWLCKNQAAKDLEEWIVQADKLTAPLKSLRKALVQRVLGEEYAMYSPNLAKVKSIIAEEISPARDRMVDALIASVCLCDAWADPSSHRTVLPDVYEELRMSIIECRHAFHCATEKATAELKASHSTGTTNTPTFAYLTRRMSAFNALFELGDSLLAYLEKHNWENEEIKGTIEDQNDLVSCINNGWECLVSYSSAKWLWHSADSFRLALKTSIGMVIASLFVSVPFLWNMSAPFGLWPGLTIASVNLADTGSSFKKASDRLFGTLLAAAYALLVSDLLPGNEDYVKIPAIGLFTYVVIYLKDAGHAYKYTYAATSIGSMLYGSIKNDFNIEGYIPKRIELIFSGVVIFSIVELLLFPRSSRKMVERLGFQFFFKTRDFLKQASICTRRMEEYIAAGDGGPATIFFQESDDPFQLEKLAECHKQLKTNSSKLKKELESALDEPQVGLSLSLNPEAFRGLAKEQADCEMQALLMVKAFRQLADMCTQEGGPPSIQKTGWLGFHTKSLQDAQKKTKYTCGWLRAAYPDGRLRSQCGNSVKAVTAAASFRGFEDVRLRTISKWSDQYAELVQESNDNDQGEGSINPMVITSLGITATYILELCRHIQKAGIHVEHIAYNFPAKK